MRRFYRVPTSYVLSKNKKNIAPFHLKIIIFTAVKKRSILHGRVFVMYVPLHMVCLFQFLFLFPFWFRWQDFVSDCVSSWSFLIFYFQEKVKDGDPWSTKQHHWKCEAKEDYQLSPVAQATDGIASVPTN